MKVPFKVENVVFEGGGAKGIGYGKAIAVFEQKGYLSDVKRVAGTSAGAITATIMALGGNSQFMIDEIFKKDFEEFKDKKWGLNTLAAIRVFTHHAPYQGNKFSEWIQEIIEKLTNDKEITFAACNPGNGKGFKDIHILATNLSRGVIRVFSAETTPDMPIWKAVRASMSIPGVFEPVEIDGEIYVDGGILNNYHINRFDRQRYLPIGFTPSKINWDYPQNEIERTKRELDSDPWIFNPFTIGFRVDSAEEIQYLLGINEPAPKDVSSSSSFIKATVSAALNSQNERHINSIDRIRSVYIYTLGIGTIEFSLSNEQKQALLKQGEIGAMEFLEWRQNWDGEKPRLLTSIMTQNLRWADKLNK